jgi:hypothetical protein
MATMLQVFFIREEIFIDLSFINLIFDLKWFSANR